MCFPIMSERECGRSRRRHHEDLRRHVSRALTMAGVRSFVERTAAAGRDKPSDEIRAEVRFR